MWCRDGIVYINVWVRDVAYVGLRIGESYYAVYTVSNASHPCVRVWLCQGAECTVESPWQTLVVTSTGGQKIPTTSPSGGLFAFATTPGETYILTAK